MNDLELRLARHWEKMGIMSGIYDPDLPLPPISGAKMEPKITKIGKLDSIQGVMERGERPEGVTMSYDPVMRWEVVSCQGREVAVIDMSRSDKPWTGVWIDWDEYRASTS